MDLFSSISGAAFRPSYFNGDVFTYEEQYEDFPEVAAFFVDDIFLSGYLGRNNVPVVVIPFEETDFQKKSPSNVLDGNTANNAINPLSSVTKSQPDLSKQTIAYFGDIFSRKL